MAFVLALLVGCVVGGGEQHHVFHGVTGVTVELGNGDVLVSSETQRSETDVFLDLGGVGRDTARGDLWTDRGGWLTVDARGAGLGGGDIEVRLPAGLPVEVFVDRGDVDLLADEPTDLFGCVGAGDVSMEVPAGAYRLELSGGAGHLEMDGVWNDDRAAHRLGACAGAGHVEIVGW